MNIESLGSVAGLAGTPMAETRMTDDLRARAAQQNWQAAPGGRSAEEASGVPQTSGGEEIGDSDNSARMAWQLPASDGQEADSESVSRNRADDGIGRHVDLSG